MKAITLCTYCDELADGEQGVASSAIRTMEALPTADMEARYQHVCKDCHKAILSFSNALDEITKETK